MRPRIGGAIATIVIGLIVALALPSTLGSGVAVLGAIDLSLIGWILVAGGLVWLLLEMLVNRPRTVTSERRSHVDPESGQAVEQREVRDI